MVRPIEGQLARRLQEIILLRYPNEAAGVILDDDSVIEIPNRAEEPQNTFSYTKEDLALALSDISEVSDITLWHSHPQGGIGPSRIDMQQKTPLQNHLVISLVAGELVYTWY